MLDTSKERQYPLGSAPDEWMRIFELIGYIILFLIRWPWMLLWNSAENRDVIGRADWPRYRVYCLIGMATHVAIAAGIARLMFFPDSSVMLTQYLLWGGAIFFALFTVLRFLLWAKHAMR